MTRCYAYTRVSTLRQGEKGVSLQEQRSAISQYSARYGIEVVEWFEERLTAAKQGRPLFTRMLKQLRAGQAKGVVIHKIDRSARNLRDWAELGELIDAGVLVHFANDSVDLQSRGGRLSADIQAVVAADFIRNLREETLKGMRGRLKQGLLPFRAPLGYLDTGAGKAKAVDPRRGPFVRQAFELYATGRYTLESLMIELHHRGLRNRHGRPLSLNGMSCILNNPFYAGLIRIRTTDETYQGIHTAIIPMGLFKQVQQRLAGKLRTRGWIHDFTFRGVFHCSLCTRPLLGEEQKGHVYYRCHSRGCPSRSFREEVLEATILKSWPSIAPSDEWRKRLLKLLEQVAAQDTVSEIDRRNQLQAQIGGVRTRHVRLVDALLDCAIDKASFEARRRALLEEEQSLRESLQSEASNPESAKRAIAELLELASSAQQSYRLGTTASRRELVIRLCSNRTVAGKDVSVEPHPVLALIAQRESITDGDPTHDTTRTFGRLAWKLWSWGKRWHAREQARQKAA